jgi:class 3 adenylate cyclase/tetratricopeptide (TPR) repeat protein
VATCASCGEDNPDRARFCLGCGSALAAVCAACGEENPGRAKFCLGCGAALAPAAAAAAPPPPPPEPVVDEEERKLDTLVFVDLVGSTALAESLDPEDVLALLEMYYARLRVELEQRGGTVEKYIGDAIVTHFGVPIAHEDDPERAVRAAFGILDTVEALNAEDPIRQIQVRIGIATGEVIVKMVARAEEGKGIAWGDILNTAARIESAAPVMGILVGENTYRASAHAIEYEEQEPIVAKGKAEPVRVWRALRVRDATTRGRTRDAPLVGRETELERLVGLWQLVDAQERPALGTIVGDPGVGKTRLLTEVVARLEETGAVVYRGGCLSYGEGITYWPMRQILEGAAGILVSDDTDTVSEKLGTLLESLASTNLDELRTMAQALANLVGAPRTPRGTYAATDISQAELHWGIQRILQLLSAKQHLVLVFEDLHWAEPTLLELVDYLADPDQPASMLILGTARRELEATHPQFLVETTTRATVTLTPLDTTASEALLTELLGGRELPPGSRAKALLENAAGNPLFLEETVAMLADAGILDGDGDLDELAVPTSLQSMIGARLDALAAGDKRVAQHASVIGQVFWTGAVAQVTGAAGPVDPALESLERHDFVRAQEESSVADEREWAFKHALTRDVAYGRVPKSRRAPLHVRFVDWLTAHPGAEDEFIEIVAYHLEQACRLARGIGRSGLEAPVERAVDALMRAADRAERREGLREADRFYARALELLPPEVTAQALELRLRHGGTLNKLGRFAEAEEALAAVADGAVEIGAPELRAHALVARTSIARKRGRASDAREYIAEAERIVASSPDRPLGVRTIYESAHVRWWFDGEGDAALAEWRRGLQVADELGDEVLQLEGQKLLVIVLYNLGRLVEAEEVLTESAALLAGRGSLRDEARASFQLGLIKYHRGDIDEAEQLSGRALAWLERIGDAFYQLQTVRTLALCAAARDDDELAERLLRHAMPLAVEIGGVVAVDLQRLLIEALLRQGRLDDSRLLSTVVLRSLPEEDVYGRIAGLLISASVATADGDSDTAASCFTTAISLLEEQQLPLDLGEARLAYGRALVRLGDRDAARAELEDVRAQLESMGARGLVDQVDGELAALAAGSSPAAKA